MANIEYERDEHGHHKVFLRPKRNVLTFSDEQIALIRDAISDWIDSREDDCAELPDDDPIRRDREQGLAIAYGVFDLFRVD